MKRLYLCSSIGKKQMMGITGLGLCGFVLAHMLGNLQYFLGPDVFNLYGEAMTGNKAIYYSMEAGLLTMFLGHIFFAILVVRENRAARPVGYAVSPNKGEKSAAPLASRTMGLSGTVILAFLIVHLINFRFGEYRPYEHKGDTIRDLYVLMSELFTDTLYTGFYLFALVVLAMHLSHALWSSLQTLGLVANGKEKFWINFSRAFGAIVSIGFALNPIYIYFIRG